MGNLKQIAKDLYCLESTLKMPGGIKLSLRTTLICLPGERLWAHSPVPLNPSQADQIRSLGNPAFVIAPNLFHHLYVGPFVDRFPDAKIYAPKDLNLKQPELHFGGTLEEASPNLWENEIQFLPLLGMPKFNEWVFFHSNSKTLICSDLVFNLDHPRSTLEKIFWRINGGAGKPTATRLFGWMIKRPDLFSRSLSKVLDWPFDRVIMAHGKIIEARGAETLRQLYIRYLKV